MEIKKACRCLASLPDSFVSYLKSKQCPAKHVMCMMVQVMYVLINCHIECGANVKITR